MSISARTAIVTSRLPRLMPPQDPWLRGLRASIRRIQRLGEILLTSNGTAGFDFIRRAAERFNIPIEQIDVPTTSQSIDENSIPARDLAVISTADCVLALGVRTEGNIHRALRERLRTGQTVVLVELSDLQSAAAREDLVTLGAILWKPDVLDQDSFTPPEGMARQSAASVIEIVPFPSPIDWNYLSHSTRACPEPWPGQSLEQHIDSLLDNTRDADHSRIAALERIVTQRRLIASHRTIRGGYSMVCLTSAPLQDLPALRRFRSHRTRWDFEPFGLCIRRDWLLERGVRPAIYGDDAIWDNLPDEDRPYFQWSDPDKGLDWSVEREWRHAGDLDLSKLPVEQGLVFVPNYEAAMRICPVSPWPVTLWPGQFPDASTP